MAVLLLWWAVVLVGVFLLTSGGSWILLLPIAVIGILVVANTIVIVRHTGPEQAALAPGQLARADADGDEGVAVWATRAPRRGAADKAKRTGTLAYEGGRLTFTTDPLPDGRGGPDPLAEVTVLDAAPRQLELGSRPTLFRPNLVVDHQGTRHVFDLSAPFDLGSGAVGAVVTAAWWDQLLEVGARRRPS